MKGVSFGPLKSSKVKDIIFKCKLRNNAKDFNDLLDRPSIPLCSNKQSSEKCKYHISRRISIVDGIGGSPARTVIEAPRNMVISVIDHLKHAMDDSNQKVRALSDECQEYVNMLKNAKYKKSVKNENERLYNQAKRELMACLRNDDSERVKSMLSKFPYILGEKFKVHLLLDGEYSIAYCDNVWICKSNRPTIGCEIINLRQEPCSILIRQGRHPLI
jgi:hypothetical protein